MRMQFSAPLPVKVRPGAGSQCPARFPLQRDEGSVDRHPQRLSAAQWRRAESFLLGRAGWAGVAAKDSRNFVRGVPRLYRGQASGYCVARPLEWAARPGLTGVLPVTETPCGQAQLAQGRLDHSAHGGHPAG